MEATKNEGHASEPGSFVGRQVAGFQLERRLGAGATGEVWLGRHGVSGGLGAAKLLSASARQNALVRDFFAKEWEVVKRLEHPNIVRVYASGEDYLVTAFVEGTNLARRLRSPMLPQQGLEICLQIASALSHAHERGVIHRDVKPANILLDRQQNAFLADFGLAKLEDEEHQGVIVGTPGYMAPEQRTSSRVGPAADLYALARVFIEILVGTHLPLDPREALALLPDYIASATQEVLGKATAADPTQRYDSVHSFAKALQEAELGNAEGKPSLSLARVRRAPDDFAWVAGGEILSEPKAVTWEADYSLAKLVEDKHLPASCLETVVRDFGLSDLGWSLFGRHGRLGDALDPSVFARATDIVVLLHGGGSNRKIWSHIAHALCQHDAQTLVLTPDVAGYGRSPRVPSPSEEQTSMRSLGLCALHLLKSLGIKTIPTVLVGHSMSGVAMLTLRDDELGPLRTRVAVSPVFPQFHPYMRFQLRSGVFLIGALKRFPRLADLLFRISIRTGATTRDLSAATRRWCYAVHKATSLDVLQSALRGVLRARCAPGEQLQRSLLVSSVDDPLVPAKVIDRAVRTLNIPAVRCQRMEKGGHMPMHELEQEPGCTAQNHESILRAIQSMMLEAEGESGAKQRESHSFAYGSTAHGSNSVAFDETAIDEL